MLFFSVNAVFNLLRDVVVGVNIYVLFGYGIVYTELDIVSNSLRSSVHIQPVKDIPLSREKTSFQGLDGVFT